MISNQKSVIRIQPSEISDPIAPTGYNERLLITDNWSLNMCRNIKTLFNFEPPATEEEIRASAEQFVRKLSGFTKPSKANEEAFARAIDEVADVARRLLHSLETNAPARDREVEAMKARARAAERFQ